MKKPLLKLLVAILVLVAIVIAFFADSPKQQIVREAYIYGYPLVTMVNYAGWSIGRPSNSRSADEQPVMNRQKPTNRRQIQ